MVPKRAGATEMGKRPAEDGELPPKKKPAIKESKLGIVEKDAWKKYPWLTIGTEQNRSQVDDAVLSVMDRMALIDPKEADVLSQCCKAKTRATFAAAVAAKINEGELGYCSYFIHEKKNGVTEVKGMYLVPSIIRLMLPTAITNNLTPEQISEEVVFVEHDIDALIRETDDPAAPCDFYYLFFMLYCVPMRTWTQAIQHFFPLCTQSATPEDAPADWPCVDIPPAARAESTATVVCP